MKLAIAPRLRKAFGLGAMQSLLRLVLGFASIKVTAVVLGPAGLTLVAQLNSFVTLCQGALVNGAGTAVVRLAAEHAGDVTQRNRVLATAFRWCMSLGAAAFVIIAGASPWLAEWLLGDSRHALAMSIAGAGVWALILNGVLLGTINGMQRLSSVAVANMLATAGGFLVFVPAVWWGGLDLGLKGAAAAYFMALAASAWMLHRSPGIAWSDFLGASDKTTLNRILAFYPMLLVHSTMTPLALIALRELMSSELGLTQTGHWQAAWRLSETYLAVVTSSVSMYFLPKLGELASQPGRLRQEVLRTVGAVAMVTALIATLLFLGRYWVVKWVFAPSFAPMADLMPWQLAGDVLKTVAWSLGFVLVALVRRRWYMTLELLVPVLYVGIAALLLPHVGIIGTVWAYGLSSIVQLVLAAVALRDILLTQREPQDGKPL